MARPGWPTWPIETAAPAVADRWCTRRPRSDLPAVSGLRGARPGAERRSVPREGDSRDLHERALPCSVAANRHWWPIGHGCRPVAGGCCRAGSRPCLAGAEAAWPERHWRARRSRQGRGFPGRSLDLSDLGARRRGVSPLASPEELALQKVVWNRRAVERNIRAAGAWAVVMQQAGKRGLTATCRPGQKHRHVERGHERHLLEHLREGFTAPNDGVSKTSRSRKGWVGSFPGGGASSQSRNAIRATWSAKRSAISLAASSRIPPSRSRWR